ncbi:uncharacterized protein PC9H_000022 [Neofusicoccum parvum]|uniref:Uncharacterized protein PC9H_000022 n=1 Tax=Neofusicoccum parvum TaxID=310453 RepID=A0ACB5RRE6_9PEZI|nr:uncharacterized protein PC9H_000022 [Neofusicoccum parvum]
MVRDWLSTCVSSHPNCSSQSANSGWLPSRLVDVGCGSAPSAPRLCLRDEIPPASPYLTLSHCWGASLTSKLTLSTLAQFRRAIPASALPRTYVDAIAVARFLGVRHLWIDSLCIVQDSARDWAAECSTMGRVYAGALCSVAAAAARSGAGGCFASRHPTCLQPLVLETTTTTTTTTKTTTKTLRRARWSVGAAAGADELVPQANAPLHARGWVLQERFLAARVVHFGRDRVFWECARGAAAEGEPAVRPSRRLLFLPRWDAARGEAVGLAFDAFLYWDLLVDAYAETALTMEKDKLPAFSGIAKAMAPHLGFGAGSGVAYLAGLWSWRLAGQLLWSVPGGGTRVRGRAPSWSWASVEGQLYMSTGKLNAVRRSDGDYLFDILRCETFPVGEDEFQEVKGGCIRGTGWLWKIPDARKLLNGPDYLTPRFADGKGQTIPATFDEKNTERSVQFLLPIQCLEYGSIEGLILERCETLPGQFVRIGHFSAASQWMGESPDLQEALLRMLKYVEGFGLVRPDTCDFEHRIKDQRFETEEAPLLGEYLYTITIV